jgi:uncharacterized membrane protein
MNKLFDLRFVIGAFFTVIGILLLGYSFISAAEEHISINRWCGLIFLVFGIFMLILSFGKDADDELLEK